MYRYFNLSYSGKLYQLHLGKWSTTKGTSFLFLSCLRNYMKGRVMPPLPGGVADRYIAYVNNDGDIITTYTIGV